MSSINPNNINGSYPVAGQDNDSQGFRDNFTNIKNNLTFAKDEIEDLQAKAILKSALTGTTLNNDLNNAILKNAQLKGTSETVANITDTTGSIGVSYADGQYQTLYLTGNANVTTSGWTTSGFYNKLRLYVNVSSANVTAPKTITFTNDPSATAYVGLSDVQGYVSGNVVAFTSAGQYMFELSTKDNGGTIFVQDLLRNRSQRVEDYQYIAPANASVSNVSSVVTSVVVNPSGTIDVANIAFPSNTAIVDGQTIHFGFGNTITALTMWGNGATISGALSTAGTTTPAKYIFRSGSNTWFRIG